MNLLTVHQALQQLSEAAQRGGLTLSRSTFRKSILPLMVARQEAQKFGGQRGTWIIDGTCMWRWRDYIAKRAALISLGADGWHSKRAYCEEDMEALVDDGLYDHLVDHPVFDTSHVWPAGRIPAEGSRG